MAQLGRALRSGRRGRRFKSCHPDHVGTSYACSDYLLHIKNQSPAAQFLLIPKGSRSRRLLICKHIRNAFGSLLTLCESAFGAEAFLFLFFFLTDFAPTVFFIEMNHSDLQNVLLCVVSLLRFVCSALKQPVILSLQAQYRLQYHSDSEHTDTFAKTESSGTVQVQAFRI